MRALFLLALVLCGGFVPRAASAADDRFFAERAQLRKQRIGLMTAMEGDREKRAAKVAAVIAELITAAEQARACGQDEALAHLLDGLRLLDAAREAPLRQRLVALPPAPAKTELEAQRKWESTLRSRRDALLAPTRRLAQEAIDKGVADVAADLMRQYLTFYPDDPVVRTNMGLTRVRGRWYGPRTLAVAKQGLDWDEALGWVLASQRARYEKGEYYDLDAKSWTTVEAADQAHATLDKPWVILTEHLELRGNAKLEELVDAANRIEAFYAQIFSAYALFFTSNGHGADLKLVFGMAEHPRLVVNIERSKPDYQRALPIGAGWSDGMFIGGGRQPASYFYVGSDQVLYHEFTHQVLGVFSPREDAPAWLAEGIAVYTQSPTWIDGNLVLGHEERNMHIQYYLRQVRAGKALPVEQVLAIESGAAWSGARDPLSNYAAAGTFAWFCMEGAERRHRADFVDFLRDSYLGQTGGHAVWDYFGETKDALLAEFKTWIAGILVHPTACDENDQPRRQIAIVDFADASEAP